MLQAGKLIEFSARKQLKYIRPLGSGGTGDTHLFEDEITEMFFAIKKYAPKDKKNIDEYYKRFIDEIKILFKISHPNIVRIYNYYLYPEHKVGYLQMEYIDGTPINEYNPDPRLQRDWPDIFVDVISAFGYLEKKKILHRDIRPANILIDNEGTGKIIDFGFGKKLSMNGEDANSIILNWPVTEYPEEITEGIYDHRTEIYFIGKLFQKILKEEFPSFKYERIIKKMCAVNISDRYSSFEDIIKDISKGIMAELDFDSRQKRIYQDFADLLSNHIISYSNVSFKTDINNVLRDLATLLRNSSLEEYVQNNTKLIECFIEGSYTYSSIKDIPVSCVRDFYQLLMSFDSSHQQVVLDNLLARLSNIPIDLDDGMPF